MFEYRALKIAWLGHDSFKIKNDKVVYIDPYKVSSGESADLIFVTHDHSDHLHIDSVKKLTAERTVIIAPKSCEPQLRGVRCRELLFVGQRETKEVLGVEFRTLPAYNTNKFREPGKVFHPKEAGGVSYLLTVSGVKLYHAGDTDHTPEMKGLQPDVAFVPVSGKYVMTAEEAVRAVSDLNPKVAVPMHYGDVAGSIKDAEDFKAKASCEVRILRKE